MFKWDHNFWEQLQCNVIFRKTGIKKHNLHKKKKYNNFTALLNSLICRHWFISLLKNEQNIEFVTLVKTGTDLFCKQVIIGAMPESYLYMYAYTYDTLPKAYSVAAISQSCHPISQ